MPFYQAEFFAGSNEEPFYTEVVEAASREDAVRVVYQLVADNVPVGMERDRIYTLYRPGMATHVRITDKSDSDKAEASPKPPHRGDVSKN